MSQGMLTILSAENHNHASSMLANTLIDLISQNNGETTIGLAGGSTPSLAYSILGQETDLLANVIFWLTDERWVHHDDDLSNSKMIKSSFDMNDISLLYPDFSGDNATLDAEKYTERVLSSFTEFTCAVLGVGEDGHTASLFPGSNALDEKGVKFVSTNVEAHPRIRLTATFELLAEIKNVYLLVTGNNKKDIVEEIVKGETNLPVNHLINIRTETHLLTDQL